uniref:Secreted protein n=1 Tax=Utricularia reniformis TaxID=192314 RepID=A0A1Y0B047_9LAMI|nr:hypothetical protein AEK19_MT0498 [Utricularia reniformis]ART30754.1 hypothetical protein AEK19_MT0498 [Utricularia reniformis]
MSHNTRLFCLLSAIGLSGLSDVSDGLFIAGASGTEIEYCRSQYVIKSALHPVNAFFSLEGQRNSVMQMEIHTHAYILNAGTKKGLIAQVT